MAKNLSFKIFLVFSHQGEVVSSNYCKKIRDLNRLFATPYCWLLAIWLSVCVYVSRTFFALLTDKHLKLRMVIKLFLSIFVICMLTSNVPVFAPVCSNLHDDFHFSIE